MEDKVNTKREIYIPKDQQRTLTLNEDDDLSEETKLAKGDVAPRPVTTDNVSEMTGSIRESKAKVYSNSVVTDVLVRYRLKI